MVRKEVQLLLRLYKRKSKEKLQIKLTNTYYDYADANISENLSLTK